jgi:hypothetical protein
MSTAINNAKENRMCTRETSSDQIEGAAGAFASRVRANQPQAELFSRSACDGGRPGGRQTGIVRGGDALWNDIPKYRWAARLARTSGVRGCHGAPYDGALHPDSGSGESACPQAGQLRRATQRTVDKFRIQRVASVAAAILFAALAPALVMAALWHATKIASVVFAFTFAIAFYHAVFFGLPLFLVFRLKGWINVMSCVVAGFAVGAVPAGVLTWPMQHRDHMSASVDGVPTIINGVITAAGWVNYVKPVIYFGSFGALGGFAFWVALISAGIFGRGGGSAGHTRANGPASQTWVAPAFANNISTENASTAEPARAFVVLITNDTGSPELEDE